MGKEAVAPESLSSEERLIWLLGDLMNAAENYLGAENPNPCERCEGDGVIQREV